MKNSEINLNVETQILKKQRNSSIELLRIICILLIIAHHYSVHGGFGVFKYDSLNAQQIYIQILSMFGRISCSVFAIITGYYMVNSKINYKKIYYLILEMLFYSFTILIVAYMIKIYPIPFSEVFKSLFPIFWGNLYLVAYIVFCFFIPYINVMLQRLNQKEFKRLLISLIVVWSVIPTLTHNCWKFSNLDFFFVMYCTGAYERKYIKVNEPPNKNYINICILLSGILLLIISVLLLDFLGVYFKSQMLIDLATYFREYNSVISVIIAVSMFRFFKNINFYSCILSFIASSVVGIYLIHDNLIMRKFIWEVLSPNIKYINSNYIYIHSILKILLVFMISLIIDKFRIYVLHKYLEGFEDKIFNFLIKKIKRLL